MESLLNAALDTSKAWGVDFAEVRWGDYRIQRLNVMDQILVGMEDEQKSGLGVRVFHRGGWGFASGHVKTEDDAAKLANKAIQIACSSSQLRKSIPALTSLSPVTATWQTPMSRDPFDVSIKEKTELLTAITAETKQYPEIKRSSAYMYFKKFTKMYANTIGSRIDQTQVWTNVDYSVTAVGKDRFSSRSFQGMPRAMGYELVESTSLIAEAKRVAAEAVAQLTAPVIDQDCADLILLPSHTRLVIHETIGHATELDRVLGWEADFAGTSFATPEKRHCLQYGSPIFNVTADRTQTFGLATVGYDDEGVETQEWHLIRDGVLVDYATTRDTAPLIGDDRSHGCAFADNWSSIPILRMANVNIDPGPSDAPSLEQLIADTKDGILIDGMGSFSIDQQRINFQFGGDFCRRIRNGSLDEVLWNVTYEGSNPHFWTHVDAVCNPTEWRPYGIFGCAKGQPVQIAALTHGSAPLRLRNIKLRRSAS